MKTLIRVLVLSLLSVSTFAQVTTFKGDTAATSQATRINIGANASGRVGQKGSTGSFSPFALLTELQTATAGGITSINGKTGAAITLNTDDVAEGVKKYFTQALARASLSATGAIVYNATTGAFSFSGSAADVGLGNVNNTSDASKPVSTAQQAALDQKANSATSIYRDNVASYAALTAYSVPAGQTYLIRVAADESQSAPYNTNQWYLKDSGGATFKLSLIKQ